MPQVAQPTYIKSERETPSKGLFQKLQHLIHKGYEKKVDSIGLAVVRILYSLNLIFEIGRIDSYKELIYDPMPFVRAAEVNFDYILIGWMVAQFLVMIGLFTRYAAVAAYVFCFVCLGTSHEFEYHMYYAYTGTNLLMMFMPLNRSLSVDNLIQKKMRGGLPKGWQQVGVINYYAIMVLVLGAIYFESVFYKFASPMWQHGLGMWQPIATIQIGISNWFWIMDQEYFMYALSWLTLVFESLFIFLCFSKRWRPWLLLVGVGLHLGIYVFFPIPFFAMGFIALLLILMPTGFWRKFIPREEETLSYTYEPMPALWRDRVATAGFLVLGLLRLNTFYTTYVFQNTLEVLHLQRNRVNAALSRISNHICHDMSPITGITHATVFLNFHFDNYNHVLGLRALDGPHKGELLPLSKEDGSVGPMLEAYTWAYYGFRAIGPAINPQSLNFGLERGTAFWMGKNHMDPRSQDASFEVIVKKVEVADHWEAGFRKRQLAQPWLSAGTVQWKGGQFYTNIQDIEKM